MVFQDFILRSLDFEGVVEDLIDERSTSCRTSVSVVGFFVKIVVQISVVSDDVPTITFTVPSDIVCFTGC